MGGRGGRGSEGRKEGGGGREEEGEEGERERGGREIGGGEGEKEREREGHVCTCIWVIVCMSMVCVMCVYIIHNEWIGPKQIGGQTIATTTHSPLQCHPCRRRRGVCSRLSCTRNVLGLLQPGQAPLVPP